MTRLIISLSAVSVSAVARKQGIISKKPLLKAILALDWTWYIAKKMHQIGGNDSKDSFLIQQDDPFGFAEFEDGYVYRYCGMDEYVFFCREDYIAKIKPRKLNIDADGAAIYEACRRYARSSNSTYLKEIAKLDAEGRVPKSWKKVPVIKMYRGIRLSKALINKLQNTGSLQLKSKNTYSSWSINKKIAKTFVDPDFDSDGVIVGRKIPAKDVLIYIPAMLAALKIPASHWDFDDEGELVVIDNPANLLIRQKETVS